MSVYDFCELCVDDSCTIAIWDAKVEEEVFRGEMSEAKYGYYAEYEVEGFDPPYDGVICLNIDTSED